VQKRIDNYNIGFYSLIELIKDYNICVCNECHVFIKPKPKVSSAFGIGAGILYSSISLNYQTIFPESQLVYYKDFDNKFEPSFASNFSIFYDLVLPRLNEKMSLRIELSSTFMKNKNYYINENQGFIIQTDFNINQKIFKLPLMLKYTYPKNKLTPFFYLGISNNYNIITGEFLSTKLVFSTKSVNTDYFPKISGQFYSITFLGGAGLRIKLNKKQYLYYDLRCELRNTIKNGNTLNYYNFLNITF